MSDIFRSERLEGLLERLYRLDPGAERQWGRMTAHQAVCHLSDSFKACLGDRPLPVRPPDLQRRIMRFTAFTLPLPWPKGVPTSAKVDAEKEGTQPGDFPADVAELAELMRRFAATNGDLPPHYA